jgi:very-short-patch-repair endonuclease
MVSPGAVAWAIGTHSRRGRPGIPALRDALAEWMVDGVVLDSELERLMKRLIKRHKLPLMQFHAIIRGYEVDWWVVDTPIVVECDGFEYHDKWRELFEPDRTKRNELAAAGFIVVHVTYKMLKRQPQWVAAMIRNAVERWRNTIRA